MTYFPPILESRFYIIYTIFHTPLIKTHSTPTSLNLPEIVAWKNLQSPRRDTVFQIVPFKNPFEKSTYHLVRARLRGKAKKTRGIPSRATRGGARSGTRDRAIPGPVPALLLGIDARRSALSAIVFLFPRERASCAAFACCVSPRGIPVSPPPCRWILDKAVSACRGRPCTTYKIMRHRRPFHAWRGCNLRNATYQGRMTGIRTFQRMGYARTRPPSFLSALCAQFLKSVKR